MQTRRGLKIALVVIATLLLSISVVGLFTLAMSPLKVASLALAYTAGLSMILLPCTLPAVLVIVPLCMGRDHLRGLLMALLFGLGLTVTISTYGLFTALLGKVLYLDRATLIMWLIAGAAAYLFGLSELKVVSLNLPAKSATLPGFIAKRSDYLRSLGLGLLLGNAGIGCPNPAFYVLLTHIAASGSLVTGGTYGLIHGIGRATPLIAFAVLAILGVSATGWLVKKREAAERAIGWGLVALGSLILPKPLFGHAWWEESVFHKVWNSLVGLTLGENIAESASVEAALGDVPGHGFYQLYWPWIFVGIMVSVPLILRYLGRAPSLLKETDHGQASATPI